jgi:hypothetical protein
MPKADRNLPSLHQIAAFTVVYRKLVYCWGAPPLVVIVAPFLLNVIMHMINWVTGGYGAASCFVFAVTTVAAFHLISRLSSSKKSLEVSLARNVVRLPLGVFVASCMMVKYLIGPMFQWLFGLSLSWSPAPLASSVPTQFNIAFVLGLLGFAVVFRYVGPQSISKCPHEKSNHAISCKLMLTCLVCLQCAAPVSPCPRTRWMRLY